MNLLTRFLTELMGSFFFIGTILVTGEPLPSALALLAVIYFGGKISGGHYNPAVSTAFLAKGTISGLTWLTYVIAQVIGALIALAWVKYSSKTPSRTVLSATRTQ